MSERDVCILFDQMFTMKLGEFHGESEEVDPRNDK
jgi:hypothetical protein